MGAGRSWFIMGLVLLVGLTTAPAGRARIRRRPRNVMELEEDWVKTATTLFVGITDEGADFFQRLGVGYRPWEFFGVGLGWGYGVSDQGRFLPGSLDLGFNLGLHTPYDKGFKAYLDLDADVSLWLGDTYSQEQEAAGVIIRQIAVDEMTWAPGAVEISLDLDGSLFLAQTHFSAEIGPRFVVPLRDTGTGTGIGLHYHGGLSFGYGDRRGGVGLGLGAGGLAELNGDKSHLVTINAGLSLWFGSAGLHPYLGVIIPVFGPAYTSKAAIYVGMSWKIDARPAKIAPQPTDPTRPAQAFLPLLAD